MHIVEGFLPIEWCLIWFIISMIFIIIGIRQIIGLVHEIPESKKFLAVSGVFMFVASLLHFPSVTGAYSHPVGNGLSGSVFGPAITSVLAAVILLLHAFLLGYGGLTTLGANIFSIGIVGPFAAYLIFYALKDRISPYGAIIFASFFGSVFTCLTTAVQYALVYGGFYKFFVIFFITQLPLSILDAMITTVVFVVMYSMFKDTGIFSKELKDFLNFK